VRGSAGLYFHFSKDFDGSKSFDISKAHNSFAANKMRRPVPLFFDQNIIECNSSQSTTELPIVVIDSVNGNAEMSPR